MVAAALVLAETATLAKSDDKKKVEIISTEQLEFVADGIIRIQKSFGELHVEGWDKPVVEVTVIKSIKAGDEPRDQEKAREKLGRVKVSVTKESKDSVLISSVIPFKRGLNLEYKIKVPQRSDLFIKHDTGEVNVSYVVGNMEITNRTGEIDIDLLDGRDYNIDAKTKIGGVESAFSGKSKRSFLVSEKFVREEERKESYRIYLRVGIGQVAVSKNIGKIVNAPAKQE
jgi:hypothetical protein